MLIRVSRTRTKLCIVLHAPQFHFVDWALSRLTPKPIAADYLQPERCALVQAWKAAVSRSFGTKYMVAPYSVLFKTQSTRLPAKKSSESSLHLATSSI